VNQGLHRREVQGSAEAADYGPEDNDRRQAAGEHHRQGARGVEEQAHDVGPFAADEVAHLAADQDEGR
jgi:hypothetical protein